VAACLFPLLSARSTGLFDDDEGNALVRHTAPGRKYLTALVLWRWDECIHDHRSELVCVRPSLVLGFSATATRKSGAVGLGLRSFGIYRG